MEGSSKRKKIKDPVYRPTKKSKKIKSNSSQNYIFDVASDLGEDVDDGYVPEDLGNVPVLERPSNIEDHWDLFPEFTGNEINTNWNNSINNSPRFLQFFQNQLIIIYYKLYAGHQIKRAQMIKFDSKDFNLEFVKLSSFGHKLCLKLIHLFHYGKLPPKSGCYEIVEDVLDIGSECNMVKLVNFLKNKTGLEKIYSHIEIDLTIEDQSRLMIGLNETGTSSIQFYKEYEIIMQWFFKQHDVNSPHLLWTEQNCGLQEMHTDDQYSFKHLLDPNGTMSYSSILALNQPAQLRFAVNVLTPPEEFVTIIIPPFSACLFCGNTVHSY